jgi:cytoskeletal protein RodZ
MVGVVDSVTGLSGFIDPNASLFQNYTGARAADLADGLDYSASAAGSNHRGPSVFTLGNVIAGRQIYSATTTALTPSGAVTIDGNLGQVFTLAQGSGIAVTLSAIVPPSGSVVYLIVTQAGTAAAITQLTNVKMASVTPTSGKTTTISFVSDGVNLNQFASAISA